MTSFGLTASDQFARKRAGDHVKRGDVVWLVNFERGRLFLIGRLVVGQVMTRHEAQKALEDKGIWDARWHVLAIPETQEPLRRIDVTARVAKLTFVSATKPRVEDLTQQSFRPLRRLTPRAAEILRAALEKASATSVASSDAGEELGSFEGEMRWFFAKHRRRENSLRAAKIENVFKKGSLACEVEGCGFDFEKTYGDLGLRFAHVHHTRPLAVRHCAALTRLADLVVVCANCHAMISPIRGNRSLAEVARAIDGAKRRPAAHRVVHQ